MNYYIDLEFHESKKPVKFLGFTLKKIWTIDLISIGIVSDDNREYYAISKECDIDAIWKDDWLRTNVLPSIYSDLLHGNTGVDFDLDGMKFLLHEHGKSIEQIAEEIKKFVYDGCDVSDKITMWGKEIPIKFYGYYPSYDWVCFCWIFGRMIDLPTGFPMRCIDLRQEMKTYGLSDNSKKILCPDPDGEHNALIDARWNKKLHQVILTHKER